MTHKHKLSPALLAVAAVSAATLGLYAAPESPIARRAVSPVAYAAALAPKEKPKAMHDAAQAFLKTLTPEQRKKAVYSFDAEERFNWHFVPRERNGLPYLDLNAQQREAAARFLGAALSEAGYKKTETIRALDEILRERERDTAGRTRNRDRYFFTFFGEPGAKGVWGWRYEGHHISLNGTVVDGKAIASSPQFLGSNPAKVPSGAMAGVRALAAEEDLGRALVKSLGDEQRKTAVLAEKAPSDILTGAQRKAAIQEDKGIAYKDLPKDAQKLLLALIEEHAGAYPQAVKEARLQKIRKAGLDAVKFAWMGGLEAGQGHYYRVQGPTFLIEYDNTQNSANHVHAVWRDFSGDFGRDYLQEHYSTSHK